MSAYRLGCLGDLPSPARRGERLALESPASTSSPSRRTPASASSTEPTLDLTGSGVTCLVRDVLALQPEARILNLRELLCTGNELQRVDPVICRSLQRLELLCLSGNRLRSLPADLGQLRSLKMLRLEANCLADLPWQIGELQQLEQLWLGCNELSSLPESIGSLRRLRELWLVSNQLSSLPHALGELVRLERLELSENQLRELPESTARLARLQELWLRGNQLAEWPPCLVGGLPSLALLDVSHNRLAAVPPTLAGCATLTTLRLEGNLELCWPDRQTLEAGSPAVLACLRSSEARASAAAAMAAAAATAAPADADAAGAAAWVDTALWESWVAEDGDAAEQFSQQLSLRVSAADDTSPIGRAEAALAGGCVEAVCAQHEGGASQRSELLRLHGLCPRSPAATAAVGGASPSARCTSAAGSRAAARCQSKQRCTAAYYEQLLSSARLGRATSPAAAPSNAAPSAAAAVAAPSAAVNAQDGNGAAARANGNGRGCCHNGCGAAGTAAQQPANGKRQHGHHAPNDGCGGGQQHAAAQPSNGRRGGGGGRGDGATSPLAPRQLDLDGGGAGCSPPPPPSAASPLLRLEQAPPMHSLLRSFGAQHTTTAPKAPSTPTAAHQHAYSTPTSSPQPEWVVPPLASAADAVHAAALISNAPVAGRGGYHPIVSPVSAAGANTGAQLQPHAQVPRRPAVKGLDETLERSLLATCGRF